ncbi:MAG: site-2 protease family protein [Candidatus Cloacimonadota bacterium]|nr:site-2 protease family protein [Candidatus Cloacimonadota bacterium]
MDFLTSLIIQLPILFLTLTVHEYSHGLVAFWLGDDTAKRAGRLTMNPISHIDPLGLIMLFIVHIGWAKPVPINPYNFQNQKRDMALSAAAGPVSNFVFAIILAIIFRFFNSMNPTWQFSNSIGSILILMLFYAVMINLALGLFNLIPIPPLDGSKIIGGFMSDELYYKYTAQERKGAQILIIIFAVSFIFKLNIIGSVIIPPLNFFLKLLTGMSI